VVVLLLEAVVVVGELPSGIVVVIAVITVIAMVSVNAVIAAIVYQK